MATLIRLFFRRIAAGLAASALLFTAASTCAEVSEESLKAAFIYNFAYFSVWPNEDGGQLKVCVLGEDDLGAPLDAIGGRRVRGMTLTVQRKVPLARLSACHLAFVPAQARGELPQVLKAVAQSPVMVVVDSEGAAQLGATISLLEKSGGHLAFEINMNAIRAAGLKVSSRMIELAHRVY